MQTKLTIQVNQGDITPSFPADATKLHALKAVVTKEGSETQEPVVDFVVETESGKIAVLSFDGSVIKQIASHL